MWIWPPLGFACGLAWAMFAGTIGDWADEEKRALTLAGGLIVIAAFYGVRASSTFVDDEDRAALVIALIIGVAAGLGLRAAIGGV